MATTTAKIKETTEVSYLNETTKVVPNDILAIFGPSNPYFDLIHYTALVCLSISIIISLYTVVYLLKTERGSVFTWKIGKCIYFSFSLK